LLTESIEKGLKLFTQTRVEKVTREDYIEIHTNRGVMRCNKLIYATNAWSEGILPENFKGKIMPHRNHVCALRRTSDLTKPLNYALSYRDDFVYAMPIGDEVILGGFRDVKPDQEIGNFDDGSLDADILAKRDAFIAEWLPGYEITHEWTGIFGMSDDPWIGPLPYSDDEYIVAGFQGQGLPRCFLAGEIVSRMCLGEALPPELEKIWPTSFLPKSRKMWWNKRYNERIAVQCYAGAYY